ncbi:MAG: ATP-binding protein [Oscillospiraceae bacterium]|nr:ATP-binding protein [Oscillospiraceae bacterium]
MADKHEAPDTYVIPPNFIETGTIFGGMFKLRNAIEAGVLAAAAGLPFLRLQVSLTTKIILLCLTALPLGLIALIGVSGESLSSFIMNFFRFVKNRRVIKGSVPITARPAKKARQPKSEVDALKQQLREAKRKQKPPQPVRPGKKRKATTADYLNIEKIENGVVYTRDHRYVKIIEVVPINFLLRSAREQRNIIYSFISFLKISPVKMQFKVLTKRADIGRHIQHVREDIAREPDERCRALQEDYEQLLRRIGSKEAVTRRFFIIFEYEPVGRRDNNPIEAISALQGAVNTARTFLLQCGNEILSSDNEDEFTADVLYNILNRRSSADKPLAERAAEVMARYVEQGREAELDLIPAAEFFAPDQLNFKHGRYIYMDGVYHSYLLIPSGGFKHRVSAGWLSLLVNAGDGIDVDVFLQKQPKDRVMQRLGQQLRINRSKIKDASDTNTDFDDIEGAIRSGYFLKEGLADNEDFYYMNILITITAESADELEWRTSEMKKLMISQDLDVAVCTFRQEQAFNSALPLIALEKKLFERGKRNVLTLGAASCYPFTSFEMCDDNGILLGVNKHNNSLIIVDIFNSRVYKNANMAIMGTSGAGKTYTMQLMALRMRRKNIQVFIIAPLKGHEFYRACQNIGGSFVQVSPASRNCINVMEIRQIDNSVSELLDGSTMDRSELAAKIQRLHIFFSLLIPDMNHEEKQLLDEALIRTYAEKGITHNNDSLPDPEHPERYREMPILGDLHAILLQKDETRRMANILNRLVHGSASSFNQQTNVDLENKYVVLDISELTGDLLTVGMFVALDFVWDKAKKNRTEEKAIFIDETWQLIGAGSNRLAAEFVLEIFKIIRGYGGSAICATQDLNDFFALDDGKYGKGIINNAKTKIILNLEDEEARRVQQVLHLSEAEVMAITHFERGNGLISTNNNNITVEFKSSPLEGSLITSDRRELMELMARKRAIRN